MVSESATIPGSRMAPSTPGALATTRTLWLALTKASFASTTVLSPVLTITLASRYTWNPALSTVTTYSPALRNGSR